MNRNKPNTSNIHDTDQTRKNNSSKENKTRKKLDNKVDESSNLITEDEETTSLDHSGKKFKKHVTELFYQS